MGIAPTSRYATGHFDRTYPDPRRYPLLWSSGYAGVMPESVPVITRRYIPRPLVDSLYIWRDGDRWDTVAQSLGIPKTDWWRLLDANPQIEFPTAIQPGDVISVPMATDMRML